MINSEGVLRMNANLDNEIREKIKDEITQNFLNNCKLLSFFNDRNADIITNSYATANISMNVKLSKLILDKWKRRIQNISILNALGISDQIEKFSNYVERFILIGAKAEKSQSIILEDEDRSECLIPNYDSFDPIEIKNEHDFYIILRRMKNDFEGIAQGLSLLYNTTFFEDFDLQSIKERLKIKDIYHLQSKDLVCLIKPQELMHLIRYYKVPFQVLFVSGGGLIGKYYYEIILYWGGAIKIRSKKAIQWRKINLRI